MIGACDWILKVHCCREIQDVRGEREQNRDRMSVVLGSLATAVSALFAASMFHRYRARGGKHHIAWGTSMAMFAAASAALTAGLGIGWSVALFKVYYLFGAILNVPYLGLGNVYLLWGDRAGYTGHLILGTFLIAAVVTILATPVTNPPSGREIPSGKEVYAVESRPVLPEGCNEVRPPECTAYTRKDSVALVPRLFAVFGNISGTLMVVGSTLYSALRFFGKRKEDPDAGRLALGNVLIALGVMVVASGGTSARFGTTSVLPLTLASGVSIIYGGFLVATRKRVVVTESAIENPEQGN